MSRPQLRRGSTGPDVVHLQTELNRALSPSPGLKTDGLFGTNTRSAVLRFQNANWLTADGIVGQCTWSALEGTETYCVLHNIRLVPQPTDSTCWAASTAMILHQPTPVTAPAFMLTPDGSLLNDSELNDARITSQFARHFGLRLYPGQSWLPSGLASVIEYGPVMCNVLWDVEGYVSGAGSAGHMVVFAGIRGNGHDLGTTIRVYDPLPVSHGSIYSIIYGQAIRRYPAMTYQLFQV
jgi:hypothetical protein